ncbi:MAG: type II toxin-antitoxin system death-on-curing family toxin [Telluria sp.]
MTYAWVQRDVVFAIHDKQLAVHGGLGGVRDMNAVESAINRAQNLDAYGDPRPDVAALAAAYIYGIATSHGFSDGNKRTAWVVGRMFLALNGEKLEFTDVEAINFMLAVASGTTGEQEAAEWIREHLASAE